MTDVAYERQGKTAIVRLNRPESRNAISSRMHEQLEACLKVARDDAEVKSIVLTGAGQHFCSGADLRSAHSSSFDDEKVFLGRDIVQCGHRWLSLLVDMEKPVIAAVDGAAVGAGFSLALAADFVIATPHARFIAAFARIGLVPDMALLYLLPRLVGLARAKEILFCARDIAADEALSLGFVQAVVPAERLGSAALAFAQQFDSAPPRALGMIKTILNRSFETNRETVLQLEAAAQGLCAASAYAMEAQRRFMAGEPGQFKGTTRLADL